MKVSVLLVSYNQEAYIAQCVESIAMQEVPFDVEIIVADDFSSDETLAIIKKKLERGKFPCRFLPSDKNLGLPQNYKRGFEACCGEYVAVMEGDDYWTDKKRLEKLAIIMDSNNESTPKSRTFLFPEI